VKQKVEYKAREIVMGCGECGGEYMIYDWRKTWKIER